MRHTFVWCASTSSGAPTDARNGSIVHGRNARSEEHTSELQSQSNLVCRLLLEKKKHLEQCTVMYLQLFFLPVAVVYAIAVLKLLGLVRLTATSAARPLLCARVCLSVVCLASAR